MKLTPIAGIVALSLFALAGCGEEATTSTASKDAANDAKSAVTDVKDKAMKAAGDATDKAKEAGAAAVDKAKEAGEDVTEQSRRRPESGARSRRDGETSAQARIPHAQEPRTARLRPAGRVPHAHPHDPRAGAGSVHPRRPRRCPGSRLDEPNQAV